MYKRLFCFAVIGFSWYAAVSQITVSLHEPPIGVVQKSQLWNITLVYSGNAPITVTIGLSLFDIRDNQAVMTAFTKPITLTKGIKQLKALDVAPVEYNYFSPAFDMSRLPDALLPIGNYRGCYVVYAGGVNSEGALSEDCINLEIQPLSPPELNMPSDSAVLETPYPQFDWLPPVPIVLFHNLNYDLLVAEVQPGQTPDEAIQENLPVYTALRLTSLVNNYPASNKSLDTGRVYAWRIIAKNGEMFAAQSEVWTFSVNRKKPEMPIPPNGTYLELRNDNSYVGTATIPGNILGIKFYSYDKTHDAVIRFMNDRGEVVKETTRSIQYGNNFVALELDHSFSKDTNYYIEITDLQNSRYKASFRMAK